MRHAAVLDPHSRPTGSGPRNNYLGSDIRAAYYGGSRLTGAGQSVGLLELGGYNMDDVNEYFSRVNQPENVPVIGVSVNGASLSCTGSCDDSEQVLDMEEAISMAPGLSSLIVYVGKYPVSVLARMAADNQAKQLSSSWGWLIASTKLDEPIFKEYAAQGQSFVDATGDYGYHLRYGVVWPADDAWVTAAGGTVLTTDGPGGPWASESGWSASGGGPSPHSIPIPSYQRPFINAANQGSGWLRNVPDIAGVALDFFSCYNGACYTGNGGTSYAAPLLAGFVALANEQADCEGRPSVGFLNPALYAIGGNHQYDRAFHDEATGDNGRYDAVTGFDLVTGFGSPNGQGLIDALVSGG
jgi:kumamolisin